MGKTSLKKMNESREKKPWPEVEPDSPEYKQYLKDHQKRLKRLERELRGDNMEKPMGDYE